MMNSGNGTFNETGRDVLRHANEMIRSHVFPDLQLSVVALLNGDWAGVLAEL